MSLGSRLREERLRLGLNQTDIAGLAGASKSAQINWEKGTNSPPATALAAYAEAGADVLYILTGRRTADRPDNAAAQIEEQLAEIRREMLDPVRNRLPDEDDHRAEERVLRESANGLRAMLTYDQAFLSEGTRDEVEHLLNIVENPASLSLYRAADRMQLRRKREDARRGLREWLDGTSIEPNEAVMYMLVTLAIEYGAPVKFLAELVYEMHRNDSEGAGGA